VATRQKLKNFLSDRYSTSIDRVGITIDPTDMGPTDSFNEGDDLGVDPATGDDLVGLQNPQTEGGLIGDFLKYITDLSDNAYRLKGGNTMAVSLNSRLGNEGIGVPLEASDQQGAEDVFVAGSESERNTLGSVMAQYSNGYFSPETLQTIISKDNTNPELGGKHAQEMLSEIEGTDLSEFGKTFTGDIPGDDPGDVIKKAAQQVLFERSRFNPSYVEDDRKAFVPQWDATTADFEAGVDDMGTSTAQAQYGSYNKNSVRIILDDLKNVGASLLLKSANWDRGGASDPDNFDYNAAVDSNLYADGDFVGGTTNATKIDPSELRAGNAAGAPHALIGPLPVDEIGSFRTNLLNLDTTESSKSFGSMTTDGVMFNNETNKIILIAQASAAVSAMINIAKDTWDLIGDGVNAMVRLERGPYFKGQPTAIPRQANFAMLRNTALVPTRNPYKDCVDEGFKVLFDSWIGEAPFVDADRVGKHQQIAEAPGFWFGVARKILRGFVGLSSGGDKLVESFTSTSNIKGGISSMLHQLQNNDIIRIMNVAAMIGDVSITTNGKIGSTSTQSTPVGPWNVDRLPDGPATRVSKSRTQKGMTSSALAWRGNSVPALYMIPRNVMLASIQMGTLGHGTNPLKGMLGSTLAKSTYIDVSAEGASARIPGDIVERFENLLDAEYVPFYFHDLRTNEIITFHAFLDDLSDSYQADYSSVSGYGRVDAVQIYRTTSRKIRFAFHVAATSKEDFNEMWWKINKLTTLVYPQWTEGTKISTNEGKSTFIQPFSQVLGSSPVIRLRIGDVIKSNYSGFNLARIFGIGNSNIFPTIDEYAFMEIGKTTLTMVQFEVVFALLYGSPMATLLGGADRAIRAVGAQLLKNGFANPLGLLILMRELQDPDSDINPTPASITAAGALGSVFGGSGTGNMRGYTVLSFPYLKASINDGYVMEADAGTDKKGGIQGIGSTRWRITHPIRVMVLSRDQVILSETQIRGQQSSGVFKGNKDSGVPIQKTRYTVMVMDFNAPAKIFGRKFIVSHSDLMPNPDTLFNTYVLPTISIVAVLDLLVQGLANEVATITGLPADTLDVFVTKQAEFMHPDNNPLAKSFESTAGRGLAGVIKSINYTWLDATNTWEIDWNSRAPKFFKVQIDFDPIHDIPPGLDYSGYNRAPLYNVGDTMQKIAGDPYRDEGRASHDSYKNQGRLAAQSNNPDED